MHSTKSGKEFENAVAKKLKKMGFKKLDRKHWSDCKDKYDRCFTQHFPFGCSLWRKKRFVDFRVKFDDCGEFDVEAKYKSKTSGTTDQIAWVALHVANTNDFPFFLVVGGETLTNERRNRLPVLRETAASFDCVLGVGTLEEFAAKLKQKEFAVELKRLRDQVQPPAKS